MTDADSTTLPEERDGDALAALIRAAGRRPIPSATEYERVRLASHLAWQMKVHASRRRRVLWFALAAGVAATTVGVLVGLQPVVAPTVAEVTVARGRVERFAADTERWEPLMADAVITAGTRLRTGPDSGAGFAVPGGIVVRVAGATSWAFAAATRLTLEAGTLYVDTGVEEQAEGLEIATVHGVVRDIGTQFEVRALTSELRLRVRQGSVEVRSDEVSIPYDAPAGEELTLAADGAVARVPFAADDAEWRWAEVLAAPIELDGGSAFDALQWIARETGKRLVFEDATAELRARNAVIHGSSAGLEPLQVLEVVMATSTGLDYMLGDGTLVVRRR